MVYTINKKTKQPHQFTDADWELARQNGLSRKFKIVSESKETSRPGAKRFSPPELDKKVEQMVDNKKEEKPKGKKNKTAE